MKKIILITVLIFVTAVAVSLAVVSNRSNKNKLLSANIEALAFFEAADDPEASPYTEVWNSYIVKCVIYGAVNEETKWTYDYSSGEYYATTGPGSQEIPYDPHNPGQAFFNPETYEKVVCGKGGDRCVYPIPAEHPCVGYPY